MSENFASFYRKASSVRELVGKAPFPEKARFQITKVIELPANQGQSLARPIRPSWKMRSSMSFRSSAILGMNSI